MVVDKDAKQLLSHSVTIPDIFATQGPYTVSGEDEFQRKTKHNVSTTKS